MVLFLAGFDWKLMLLARSEEVLVFGGLYATTLLFSGFRPTGPVRVDSLSSFFNSAFIDLRSTVMERKTETELSPELAWRSSDARDRETCSRELDFRCALSNCAAASRLTNATAISNAIVKPCLISICLGLSKTFFCIA